MINVQSWQQDYEAAAQGAQSWVQGTPAVMLAPWHFQLHWQAKDYHEKGQYQLAVILSQAACDLHIEAALSELMRPLGDERLVKLALRALRRPVSLASLDVRRIWAELTGERPAGHIKLKVAPAPWWNEWERARALRHAVVHDGRKPSAEESQTALVASQQYFDHMLVVLRRGPVK